MCLIFLISSNQTISLSQTPYNYGKMWESWPSIAQITYIEGFISGVLDGVYKYRFYKTCPNSESEYPKLPEKISEQLISTSEIEGIWKVVSDLYKDPANAYIDIDNMIYLAHDKLRGKDIEKDLQLFREARYILQKQIIKESEK